MTSSSKSGARTTSDRTVIAVALIGLIGSLFGTGFLGNVYGRWDEARGYPVRLETVTQSLGVYRDSLRAVMAEMAQVQAALAQEEERSAGLQRALVEADPQGRLDSLMGRVGQLEDELGTARSALIDASSTVDAERRIRARVEAALNSVVVRWDNGPTDRSILVVHIDSIRAREDGEGGGGAWWSFTPTLGNRITVPMPATYLDDDRPRGITVIQRSIAFEAEPTGALPIHIVGEQEGHRLVAAADIAIPAPGRQISRAIPGEVAGGSSEGELDIFVTVRRLH